MFQSMWIVIYYDQCQMLHSVELNFPPQGGMGGAWLTFTSHLCKGFTFTILKE